MPIGRWVLEEACTRAAAWNVAGHRVGVSVKVSANQLNRDGFTTDVRRALQQSGLEPSLLTLEIAETTVMRDIAAAAERLEEIKQLGVRIAIDDFGSGYAHHSDLQRMPLDFLKVDRSSLAASDDEDYRSWLLEAILVVRAGPLADGDRQGNRDVRADDRAAGDGLHDGCRDPSWASPPRRTPSKACWASNCLRRARRPQPPDLLPHGGGSEPATLPPYLRDSRPSAGHSCAQGRAGGRAAA